MKNNILEEKDKIIKNDPGNMLSCIDDLPDQITDAWNQVKKFIIPVQYLNIKNIIILGMGGSAIGGDLAKSLIINESKLPIQIIRGYDIPNYADRFSLVIASSYSGNTEETISAMLQAQSKGCKIMGITTGGKVEEICVKYNCPVLKYNYNSQPRAAIGYSLMSILGVLVKLGIINITDEDVKDIVIELRTLYSRINLDINSKKNQAKELAKKLYGKIPLVIGSSMLEEVAHRYKTQINENSKQAAFWDVLPELNHNTIVGLDFPVDIKNHLFVVMLQSSYDHPRVKLRQQITLKIFEKKKIALETIMFAPSRSPYSEVFKMVFFGDYLSYYLGVLNEVNPTPVESIQFLKDKLAKN